MKRGGALAAWLRALVLVAAAFTAGLSGAQEKRPSSDASITWQVEQVLAGDATLRRMEIHVETLGGVVNLRGFVRSLEDIAKAGALVNGVRGVTAVKNGLRVADRPSRA